VKTRYRIVFHNGRYHPEMKFLWFWFRRWNSTGYETELSASCEITRFEQASKPPTVIKEITYENHNKIEQEVKPSAMDLERPT